ncbi:hypothetical protein RND81_10G086700 [Saponaria officinalis]|uniref:MADS-box domain-containing protein n=1 Tax=Saponaria officinalis TaxID=3572 RepID=A0AAW1I092_SAPOF
MVQKKSEVRKHAVRFNKIQSNITKKAYELSTLCDTPVAVIVFSPTDDTPSFVWPSNPHHLNDIIDRYMKSKKGQNHRVFDDIVAVDNSPRFEFTRENCNVIDNLAPRFEVARENCGGIDNLSREELVELVNQLDSKIGTVNAKIDSMKTSQTTTTEEQKTMMMMTNTTDDMLQLTENWLDEHMQSFDELFASMKNQKDDDLNVDEHMQSFDELFASMKNQKDVDVNVDEHMQSFDELFALMKNQKDDDVSVDDFCGLIAGNSIDELQLDTIPFDDWLNPNFDVQAQQFEEDQQLFRNQINNNFLVF